MKNNKGITMISLTITIIVLVMLTGIVAFNVTKQFEIKNINKLYADIEAISSKVSEYYLKNEKLPTYNNKYITRSLFETLISVENVNVNDGNDYYVINLSLLDNLTLNYGREYQNWTSDSKDLYIINDVTHQIYYPNGIKLGNEYYFTRYIDENNISKIGNYYEVPNNWSIAMNNLSTTAIDENNVSIVGDVTISNLEANDYFDLNSFEFAWTDNNIRENIKNITFTKFKVDSVNNGTASVRLSSRAINKTTASIYLCIGIMDKNGDYQYKFSENPISVSN